MAYDFSCYFEIKVYNRKYTNEKEGKTLGKDIKIYGNVELNRKLEGLEYNPIQLEYYKIYNSEKQNNRKPYGIGVIKRCSNEIEVDIEKREFNHIFSQENDADNMLELLLKNKVTPVSLRDILEDFVLV